MREGKEELQGLGPEQPEEWRCRYLKFRLLKEQILSQNPVLMLDCVQEQPQHLVKMQVLVHRVGVRPEILHLS